MLLKHFEEKEGGPCDLIESDDQDMGHTKPPLKKNASGGGLAGAGVDVM
jgi:hypothetical protein